MPSVADAGARASLPPTQNVTAAAMEIAHLLKQAIGLDPASIGLAAIEQAVRERQRACAHETGPFYSSLVRASAEEFQALVDAVVVPETWFFRDREAFAVLARIGQDSWNRPSPRRVLRLLSLPCSTGEEPFSMAMALLDAGLPSHRFHIDAIDVSQRALSWARQARYRSHSFRGDDRAFRDRHCRAIESDHRVVDAVRACVTFRHGNLFEFEEGTLPAAGGYDVIFCRNLLIYFDRETQGRAVRILSGLLAPAGVLFVAPSETAVLLNHEFEPTRGTSAFAFQKAVAGTPGALPTATRVRPAGPARPGRSHASPRRGDSTRAATLRSVAVEKPAANADLSDAMRLADEGHFAEAAACCEEHLRQYGPSARAFYLLGLVRDATGRVRDAEGFYRKALYIEPTHYETLVHFALLNEQQGHVARARALRKRANRQESGRVPHE